ncbi:MAG: thermonuclease family protein [Dysgonamonadaceae bacterium]|nr:thermonuclease family protein [Dysgonamonadaceae bacterium]MDD4729432.1 thermonuclease family protein [Dysgonamonadaceae bacterium]
MKQLLSLLLLFTLLSSCGYKSETNTAKHPEITTSICNNDLYHYFVKVVSISDGDTFKGLTEDKKVIKFRIYGIDAPEKHQAFGNKATKYFSDLIFGKIVGIKVQSTDYFGREVVWVYTHDGKDVSAEMLKAGMAWHFKKYDKSEEYALLENSARLKRVGLWRDKEPIAPWKFRRSRKRR